MPVQRDTSGCIDTTIEYRVPSRRVVPQGNRKVAGRKAGALRSVILALLATTTAAREQVVHGRRHERHHIGRKSVPGEKSEVSELTQQVLFPQPLELEVDSLFGRAFPFFGLDGAKLGQQPFEIRTPATHRLAKRDYCAT